MARALRKERTITREQVQLLIAVLKGSRTIKPILIELFAYLLTTFRSRTSLQFVIVALRRQLTGLQRSAQRPDTKLGDRVFWSWMARHWSEWRNAVVFVQNRTVIGWQRKRSRYHNILPWILKIFLITYMSKLFPGGNSHT